MSTACADGGGDQDGDGAGVGAGADGVRNGGSSPRGTAAHRTGTATAATRNRFIEVQSSVATPRRAPFGSDSRGVPRGWHHLMQKCARDEESPYCYDCQTWICSTILRLPPTL